MKPTIPEIPPLGISTAVLAGELTKGDAPAWIKVTPRGATQARDGRAFDFTPETLVDRFKAEGVDIPADLNHAIALKGGKGDEAEAIGWAKELQARPDGTFAKMEWLESGRAAIAKKTHRYVSPTVYHDERGSVTGLFSISLVPAPALSMPALLSAATGASAPKTMREALGLDASADETACVEAIAALRADFVPLGLFSDVVAALNASNTSQSTLRSEVRRRQVDAVLDDAIKAGKIVPAERPQYLALCASDPGFAHVSSLMSRKPVLAFMRPSGLGGLTPGSDDSSGETPGELALRATRYREARAAAGVAVTQSEAVAFAHANPGAAR